MFPVFIENSRVPRWIGLVAPIKPYAFSFWFWVWCSGRIDDRLRRHETIHFRQQVECLFIGQNVLYVLAWLILFIRYRGDGRTAYYRNPFEIECYTHDRDVGYLINRPRWAWVKYIKDCWRVPDDF